MFDREQERARTVVAICAPDACGGGVIVPAVAGRLGVPHQELSAPASVDSERGEALTDEAFRSRSEKQIEALAAGGGVIRDGGAVVLLADDSTVLRVRLDGPFDARVRQGAAAASRPEADIRAVLEGRDRGWAAYYRTTYQADLADPGWYHLIIDPTKLDWDICTDLITLAAQRLGGS